MDLALAPQCGDWMRRRKPLLTRKHAGYAPPLLIVMSRERVIWMCQTVRHTFDFVARLE